MGRIIEFNKKHVDEQRLKELETNMSDIIGNAEMTETEDGDILLDAVSEMKCGDIESQIRIELLKGGYKAEEIYG